MLSASSVKTLESTVKCNSTILSTRRPHEETAGPSSRVKTPPLLSLTNPHPQGCPRAPQSNTMMISINPQASSCSLQQPASCPLPSLSPPPGRNPHSCPSAPQGYVITENNNFLVSIHSLQQPEARPPPSPPIPPQRHYTSLFDSLDDNNTLLRQLRTDAEQAHAFFHARAKKGNAHAQFYMGVMYAFGIGCGQKNDSQATAWLQRAASQGHSDAQYYLGMRLSLGQGVLKNMSQAVSWLGKAALQGHVGAAFQLGIVYSEDDETQRDASAAFAWFEHAAKAGSIDAHVHLGHLYYAKGTEEEKDGEDDGVVPHGYTMAVLYWREAADHGDANAQLNLGLAYWHNRGVTQDFEKAVYWFRKAAEQGDAEAQRCMGWAYLTNGGVETASEADALAWLFKSEAYEQFGASFKPSQAVLRERRVLRQHLEAAVGEYKKEARAPNAPKRRGTLRTPLDMLKKDKCKSVAI